MVRARFQRDVSGGALCRMPFGLGIAKSHDLGMRATGALGVALTQNCLACNQDATDVWVWGCDTQTILSLQQSLTGWSHRADP